MNLLAHLVARLVAVVVICLAVAIGWVMVDAHRTIERETVASADRVGRHLEALYWQKLLWRGGMSKDSLLPSPDWETLPTLTITSPGVCVSFSPPGVPARQICSQVEALGSEPPAWFAYLYTSLLGSHQPITRALSIRDTDAGSVTTSAEPGAALRQSWGRVSIIAAVASVLAGCIAMLAALMIGHTLLPAGKIIQGLRELQKGNNGFRLPRFRAADFDRIAYAVNDLAEDLSRTNAARAALTTRLLQVQDDERRALARDLHDEFGQSLTATIALAALIERSTRTERDDVAEDARKIAAVQKHMMEALRTTLVRLRSQNVEEMGLEASLRQLVSDYNLQSASRTAFRLNLIGQMGAVPKQVAIDIYRIAQECLTNAVKHGTPTEVRLRIENLVDSSGTVALSVEDDGGGDASRIKRDGGHGLLGIRERISSLGGKLSISNAASGLRISATIPLFGQGDAGFDAAMA